jgi:hypothetical protein
MTPTLFERNLRRAKQDLADFISENPHIEINTCADLHDYFDANVYVEVFLTENGMNYDEANKTIELLENFIKEEA